MWKVVYIAQNREAMQKAKSFLEANGFLVQTKMVNPGAKGQSYELCVASSEAEEAYEIICNHMIVS